MITFTVYGIPAPKGSTKAFMPRGARSPVVTNDNPHTRPWAALVKDAARQTMVDNNVVFSLGAVSLRVRFYMPRPKSLPKRSVEHVKRPDLDKLVRAVKDSLTGVLWDDDSQVVTLMASKSYVVSGGMPRAEIEVWAVGIN